MLRFFRYSGNKLKYTKIINSYINKTKKTTFIEPFVGSGAVLFNLEKEFDRYIINDIDRNIIRIYKTFKEIDFKTYKRELKYLYEIFGDIKNSKESYYNFRNWFNKNHWNSDTLEEGIYLHFLANSCINSFLRFGPNGMNQSFGNRFYTLTEDTFNDIQSILKKTEIYCGSYKDIMGMDGIFFLDPPYFIQPSSYSGFSEKDIKEFLEIIYDKEYVYTDILSDFNKNLNQKLIREMNSTSPNTNKTKNGNLECVFFSDNLIEEEW